MSHCESSSWQSFNCCKSRLNREVWSWWSWGGCWGSRNGAGIVPAPPVAVTRRATLGDRKKPDYDAARGILYCIHFQGLILKVFKVSQKVLWPPRALGTMYVYICDSVIFCMALFSRFSGSWSWWLQGKLNKSTGLQPAQAVRKIWIGDAINHHTVVPSHPSQGPTWPYWGILRPDTTQLSILCCSICRAQQGFCFHVVVPCWQQWHNECGSLRNWRNDLCTRMHVSFLSSYMVDKATISQTCSIQNCIGRNAVRCIYSS